MRLFAPVVLLAVFGGCGSNGGDLNESAIVNRANAISQSANETVAAQIAEIEQKSAEDRTISEPTPPTNASDSNKQ